MKSRSGRKHHPPSQFFGSRACEVQRGSLSGHGVPGRFAVHLNAADSHPAPAGEDLKLIFFVNGAGNQRSRDHSAEAFHGEDAIDGEARDCLGIPCRNFAGNFRELALQIVNSSSSE